MPYHNNIEIRCLIYLYKKTFFNVAYLAQCLQYNQYSEEETQHQTSIYSIGVWIWGTQN